MVTVASYNLNRLSFFDKCQEGQLDQLRDLVVSEASKGVGLFCFQLASEAVLAEIQCTLTGAQFPHRIFASHDAFDAFGLGVVSRYPLGSVRTHAIPVEQGKEDKVFALTFDLKVPGERPIRFTNLWLNNSSEDARFSQVFEDGGLLDAEAEEGVLVGDFNALRKADYTKGGWEALNAFAESRGWEPRSDRVMGALTSGPEAPFEDACTRILDENPEIDPNTTSTSSDFYTYSMEVGGRVLKLRLDYVLVSGASGLSPEFYRVRHDVSLSNHFPIVCSLRSSKGSL